VTVGLTAVILSVERDQPVVLVVEDAQPHACHTAALPSARFCPQEQPCLETALRSAVRATTGRKLRYVEQLLTDYGPEADEPGSAKLAERSRLSVSYLALCQAEDTAASAAGIWLKCYDLLPWEDFRTGRPAVLGAHILPALEAWADEPAAGDPAEAAQRRERLHIAFGSGDRTWDDQQVVERFDLVEEAGVDVPGRTWPLGAAHLRLVAAGLGRLRAKIRHTPVVFELLAPEFTLFELQRTVEAVLGPSLHKQNFRRLVEGTGLVEPTGDVRMNTGGRPAKTFRFRREVLLERAAPGVHVRAGRAA
jgi:hypothetical protein